jgi:hypothetical protein
MEGLIEVLISVSTFSDALDFYFSKKVDIKSTSGTIFEDKLISMLSRSAGATDFVVRKK